MTSYKTLRISDDNYSYIQILYKRSFNFEVPLEYIRKKYETSGFGLKNSGFFAIDENDNVGAYYGVFPITLIYKGEDCLVAQSGDTMTDPDHRNRGLFTLLAKKTYQFVKENHVYFVFGFPNQNSFPGFKNKLDWEFYGFMKEFKIDTSSLPLCEITARYPSFKKLYNWYLKRKIKKWIIPVNPGNTSVFNDQGATGEIKKDEAFFKYKIYESSYLIEFNDFKFFVKFGSHLMIGAVEHFLPSEKDKFIKTVKKLGKKLLCRSVILMVSENHWLYPILAPEYPARDTLPIGFLKFENDFEFNKIAFTLADFDTF